MPYPSRVSVELDWLNWIPGPTDPDLDVGPPPLKATVGWVRIKLSESDVLDVVEVVPVVLELGAGALRVMVPVQSTLTVYDPVYRRLPPSVEGGMPVGVTMFPLPSN